MNYRIFIQLLVIVLLMSACSSAGRYVKKGNKRFNRGEYAFAIENYMSALGKGADRDYANSRIAESYRLSNRIREAVPYYAKALEAGNKADSILYYYAFALKADGKYDAASNQFSKYIQTGSKREYVQRAKDEVENLKLIGEIAKNDEHYTIKNFESLNTPEPDFSPLMFNQELYFTSSRGEGKIYAATGTGFTNLYKYKFDGFSEFSGAVVAMDSKINSPDVHEASSTLSKDGKTMVFARGNTGKRKGAKEVDLYITYLKNNEWTDPEKLPISDPEAWDSSPAFSADGKTLYFASNRKGGEGGIDIYRATRDANGRWTRVVNMGDKINTKGNELFPYVSDDGKLYFASDGHPSLGGLDIFEATREKGNIEVVNLGSPVNSRWDDFGITFKGPFEGFFSSNREGGKGDDDIYYFKNNTGNIRKIDYILAGTVVEKDETGKDQVIPDAKIKLLDNNGKLVAEKAANEDGKFSFPLEGSKNYTLVSEKPDYLTKRDALTTYGKSVPQEQLKADTTILVQHKLVMNKIVVDKAIVVENIFYDFDKADIRTDAAIELDKLVDVLNDNPQINIELGSHTDSRGEEDYNQKLSQRRAESAVAYIISRGIDKTRITAKGYGESRLIVPNAESEEDHQLNRRTEFKIINIKK